MAPDSESISPPEIKSLVQNSTCALCCELIKFLWGSEAPYNVELASDDVNCPCPAHAALFSGLQRGLSFSRFPDLYGSAPLDKVSLRKTYRVENVYVDLWPKGKTGSVLDTSIALVFRSGVANHPGRGEVLDSSWVNFDKILGWQARCRKLHGDRCEDPLNIPRVEPAWLVDLQKQALVLGAGHREFIALSYRWGSTQCFRTTTALLPKLQVAEALAPESDVGSLIPVTVRHAMLVAKQMGYQYFFADALCIPQDDISAKGREIGRMAAIYSSAAITIIAADGNGDDGILGLQGISRPRNLEQGVYPFIGDENIIETDSVWASTHLPHSYASRGWTFQEYHLSKRRLIFAESKVHWECACATWHEDQVPIDDELVSSMPLTEYFEGRSVSLLQLLRGYPSTNFYQEFLSGYAWRDLTFEGDILPAISGSLGLLTRTFDGGFVCGIPELFFDLCIIWQSGMDSHRRIPSLTDGTTTRPDGPRWQGLPSWSWIGWKGGFMHWGGSDGYVVQPIARWNYEPIIEWHAGASANGPWRKVQSRWYDYVQAAKDDEWQPPDGWTKMPYSPKSIESEGYESQRPPNGLGRFAFKHSLFPETEFFCPFPIPDAEPEYSQATQVKDEPFLSFRAKAIQLVPSYCEYNEHGPAMFKDRDGNRVGRLTPNEIEYLLLLFGDDQVEFMRDQSNLKREMSDSERYELYDERLSVISRTKQATPIELVAILKSDRGISPREEFPVYFALWIDWVDGIAYRKGIAEISVEFWDSQKWEELDVVMG